MTKLRFGGRGVAQRSLMMFVLMFVSGLSQADEAPLQLAGSGMGSPQLLPIATKGVNPFDPIALNNKAVEQMERRDYRAALVLLDRAVRLAPQHVDIKRNYQRLKRWLQSNGEADVMSRGTTNSGSTPSQSAPAPGGVLPPEPPPPWQ